MVRLFWFGGVTEVVFYTLVREFTSTKILGYIFYPCLLWPDFKKNTPQWLVFFYPFSNRHHWWSLLTRGLVSSLAAIGDVLAVTAGETNLMGILHWKWNKLSVSVLRSFNHHMCQTCAKNLSRKVNTTKNPIMTFSETMTNHYEVGIERQRIRSSKRSW